MQHQQEHERVTMMPIDNPVIAKQRPLAEHPQIQSTRKKLIIILASSLALAIIGSFSGIVQLLIASDATHSRGSGSIFQGVAAICYYGFGILVAHCYSATGLRVFAGLTIVFLTLSTLAFVIFVLLRLFGSDFLESLVKNMESDDQQVQGFLNSSLTKIIVIFIIFSIAFIISIFLIKLSIKLTYLINANKNSVVQQM